MSSRAFALASLSLALGASVVFVAGVGHAAPTSAPPAGAIPRPNTVPATMQGKIAPTPMPALTPAQRSAVKTAFKAASTKFKADKNGDTMKALSKDLDGPSGAVYSRLSSRFVAKERALQAGATAVTATSAANYGIDSFSVVYWTWVDCTATITLELAIRNRGVAPPTATPPPQIDIVTYGAYFPSPFNMGNDFFFTVPVLAAGGTATVYAGTFTNKFGTNCGGPPTTGDHRVGYLHFGMNGGYTFGADYYIHLVNGVVRVDEIPEQDPSDPFWW